MYTCLYIVVCERTYDLADGVLEAQRLRQQAGERGVAVARRAAVRRRARRRPHRHARLGTRSVWKSISIRYIAHKKKIHKQIVL